jgi:type II secretory pathway component PulC
VLVFLAAAMLGLGAAMLVLNPPEEAAPPAAGSASAQPATAATRAPSLSPAPPPAEPGSSEILPTSLPLSLVATMVRDDPSRSLATIADAEHDTRRVLTPGQTLPRRSGVTLTRVLRERVLIDNQGVIESLAMVRTDGPAPAEPPPFDVGDEERIRRRVLATRIRELTDYGLERRETPTEEQPRIRLLAEGSITPVYDDDDELLGVQIRDIEEGGIYDRIGVQEGDLLTSVNGIPFGEPAAAASVVAELTLSDEIDVGVTRPDGSAETLSMPTAELREYLDELEAQVYGNTPGERPE